MATKRTSGGRVTPKGTKPGVPSAPAPTPTPKGEAGPKHAQTASSRYTPPIPKGQKASPPWWPVLMFGLLGAGALLIIVNYMELIWTANSWVLFGGLGLILLGIVAATKYR